MKETALTKIHLQLGAKMVPFAGYNMPVEYDGISREHINVRTAVGLFDVSHMGEIWVKGPKALDFVQKVTSNDASKLSPGKIQYSCFPNGRGGIVDDLLVYFYEENKYLLVVNAANIDKDWEWLNNQMIPDMELENASDRISQLAVQGPKATDTLQKLTDINELNTLGNTYGQNSDYDRAIACFKRILELDPKNSAAFSNLGLANDYLGNFDAAVEFYLKASELDDDFQEPVINLAMLFSRNGRHDESLEQWDKLLAKNPDDHLIHNDKAIVYIYKKDFQAALECSKKAIELVPDFTPALNNIGAVYFELKEYKKAEEAFKKVIELKPKDYMAMVNLGLVQQKQGDHLSAINNFKQALEINPSFYVALNNLGWAYHEIGKFELAIEYYEKALLIDPSYETANINLKDAKEALAKKKKK